MTTMANVPFIKSITPRGLLSFGPETPPLELGPLNVLIGPNASGKSNLIDLVALVKSLPTELRVSGESWEWEGNPRHHQPSLSLALQFGKKVSSIQWRLLSFWVASWWEMNK